MQKYLPKYLLINVLDLPWERTMSHYVFTR